ncbi:hypothetical protein [Methylobacterium sp. NEAU K]|uniref:hypothetical protein n=1 Tax=Methylobacterium sp. NEAU K TaxID=3064946 RepID=UPI002733026A|nr:hypothetical protein [Methylobacterium sp. NEAU K]MDP4004971.1 hypothetical protein [Methylobacterium sp. NEAU K]
MRCALALLCCLTAQAAQAGGFAIHDLSAVLEQAKAALDARSTVQADPNRLILTCSSCRGARVIGLQLGRMTDGTEQRVRSGQTTFAALEALCVAQNPDCRLSGLPAGPAIGWITVYALGRGAGSTAVILRDGDLLTIRANADSRGAAEDSVRRLAQTVVPQIVGP